METRVLGIVAFNFKQGTFLGRGPSFSHLLQTQELDWISNVFSKLLPLLIINYGPCITSGYVLSLCYTNMVP